MCFAIYLNTYLDKLLSMTLSIQCIVMKALHNAIHLQLLFYNGINAVPNDQKTNGTFLRHASLYP